MAQQRRASINDLARIIDLLVEDELGIKRETSRLVIDERYITAFNKINQDPNQYLMVVENGDKIIATCHLTVMPSLTFTGSTRVQVEAVRVAQDLRGNKIGEWMMNEAILYAKSVGASIIQLTTNKLRAKAKNFYTKLGFEASHEGMKLYLNE